MDNKEVSFSVLKATKRLDIFLAEQLNLIQKYTVSREKIKKAILSGQVSVNGQLCLIPKQALHVDDFVCFKPELTESSLVPEAGQLEIVAQVGDILVVNKEAGLTVHPCESQKENTLVQRLLNAYPQLAKMEGLRPGIVHRLDKDTSGLVLVALSEPISLALSRAFSERKVHKKYLALVYGEPKGESGTIELPLGRDPNFKTRRAVLPLNKGGKEALTYWKKLWVEPSGLFSLVEVEIVTGRTHQIRVHFSAIGHPLLGDKVYESEIVKAYQAKQAAFKKVKRQMLHAWHIEFEYPKLCAKTHECSSLNSQDKEETGLSSFNVSPPRDFIEALTACAKRPWRVILTGSAGAGKSTVLQAFAKRGITIFSADKVVSELYQPDNEGWLLIDKLYGGRFTRIYESDEELSEKSFYDFDKKAVDKRKLFDFIKQNPKVKRDLEEFVHPLVKHALENFWNKSAMLDDDALFSVAEIPLFFEAKQIFETFTEPCQIMQTLTLDKKTIKTPYQPIIISVCCDKKIREERLKRRGLSEEDIALFTSWQWDEEKKKENSDFVVENSAGLAELDCAVDNIFKQIRLLDEEYLESVKAYIPQ
ncbi:dephospho-CoA kinase [Desulfovibrio litoralis]|uniref:Dephospho-CoA kinase n=1 Tax=Desulfovibrio litoralis DSM 11393 TaxID=1121455 RepID=A0A1M7T5X2_9BACT|nr:dephospho-CoA kinase [Desulfovibrio litoralis]SHN66088.1 23S rRNA pseudouridine1911/1915/1917 synthase [Desulfovibrio litoralis DSM 11393]